ncbi:hypothetical protein BH10CYA1_BH10CYA1_14700 [soil metagenome]
MRSGCSGRALVPNGPKLATRSVRKTVNIKNAPKFAVPRHSERVRSISHLAVHAIKPLQIVADTCIQSTTQFFIANFMKV